MIDFFRHGSGRVTPLELMESAVSDLRPVPAIDITFSPLVTSTKQIYSLKLSKREAKKKGFRQFWK
jgi:hypothetical protein